MLSKFELEYACLNVGKNKFGLQFFFFFFWLGHDLGRELGPNLVGLNEA